MPATRLATSYPSRNLDRRFRNGLLALLCFCLVAAPLCMASDSVADNIAIESRYIEDATGLLSAKSVLSDLRAGKGASFVQGRFNLGNADSRYWLYLRASNLSAQPAEVLVDTGVPFRAGLTLWLVGTGNSGKLSQILNTDEQQPFRARPSDTLHLHSTPFVIAPGATIELLADYTSRGSSYMPLSLKPPPTFRQEQRRLVVSSVAFYTVCGLLLGMFILMGFLLRVFNILLYAGLFALMMLFILTVEGYGFQYVWPESPRWNQYAGIVFMLVATGFSYVVAWLAMDPGSLTPWLKRSLQVLASLSFLLAAASYLLPFTPLVQSAGVLVLLAYLAQARTIASWMQTAVKIHLLSMASILIVLPCIIAVTALTLLDYDLPDLMFLYGNRAVFLFTVTATLASLCIYVLTLRREHEQSLEDALLAARRDAEMNRALLESEQKYMRAKELAAQSRRQLASTSHDIRQPLTSLRGVISTLALEPGTPQHETLTRALDYIEDLSRSSIAGQASGRDAVEGAEDETKPYRANLLLDTLSHMFTEEARRKGLELRTVACSAKICERPLVLMRILSNFTANAIRHCDSGAILLGCRRRGSVLRFDIIDSGPGISHEQLEQWKRPYHKNPHSEGEGLGLAICWQLAEQHGLPIDMASQPGRGSRFSVSVPLP